MGAFLSITQVDLTVETKKCTEGYGNPPSTQLHIIIGQLVIYCGFIAKRRVTCLSFNCQKIIERNFDDWVPG